MSTTATTTTDLIARARHEAERLATIGCPTKAGLYRELADALEGATGGADARPRLWICRGCLGAHEAVTLICDGCLAELTRLRERDGKSEADLAAVQATSAKYADLYVGLAQKAERERDALIAAWPEAASDDWHEDTAGAVFVTEDGRWGITAMPRRGMFATRADAVRASAKLDAPAAPPAGTYPVMPLIRALVEAGLADGYATASRWIAAGAVSVGDETITDPDRPIEVGDHVIAVINPPAPGEGEG